MNKFKRDNEANSLLWAIYVGSSHVGLCFRFCESMVLFLMQ